MSATYPDEAWPADAAVEALDGTTDARTGLPYVAKGTGPTSVPTYEVQYNRRQAREASILAAVRELQVVDEGGLNVGVYPGQYRLGGADKAFDGATDRAVFDDDTSFVYLDSANTVQIVTDATGWPADKTSFVPLAEVTAAGGDITAIADVRNRAHTHVIGPADLAASLPTVELTVDAESGDDIEVTVQVKDAAGGDLATRALVRVWVGDATYGGEAAAAPDGGLNVQTGTLIETITADKQLVVLTDAGGTAVVRITQSGDKTFYLMAELDGLVKASGAIAFTS